MTDIILLLKKNLLFATLSDDDLASIAALAIRQTAEPSEVIIKQNTTGTEIYIIVTGSVDVYIEGLSEKQRSIVVLGEGQIFGEMALIDQGYRSASVKATSHGCQYYVIDGQQFNELCRNSTHIGYTVMRNLAIDLAFKLRHRNLAEI